MRKLWLTLAGGFCGAVVRYILGAPLLAATRAWPGAHAAFPYDTLIINLSGALLLGLLFGLVEHGAPVSPDARLALGTGFLGAYTTFSSYIVGADLLLGRGRLLEAGAYVAGSMAGGVALAYAGTLLAGAGWRAWRRHGHSRKSRIVGPQAVKRELVRVGSGSRYERRSR